MAISKGSVITYSDLVNGALETIYSLVQNIDNLSQINEYNKSGATYSCDVDWGTGPYRWGKLTGTFTNSALTTVSKSTIQSEFNSFMSARGVLSKSDALATSRSILNFYTNVASFISTKVVRVGNNFNNIVNSYYVPGNTGYIGVTGTSNDSNIPTNISELMAALGHSTMYIHAEYILKVTSCSSSSSSSCSSSCSSSSSSSCSSSSSSSIFIAYMDI